MFEKIKIAEGFTPLMLGSISLIAFLSVRNGFLSTKTREICKELTNAKDDLWQLSYLLQLKYFVHRYKLNNFALMSAIFSVFLFGLMIAFTDMLQIRLSIGFKNSASSYFLIFGGLFATIATIISIFETYRGRNSLFTFIATTLITVNWKQGKYPLIPALETIRDNVRGSLPEKILEELNLKYREILAP